MFPNHNPESVDFSDWRQVEELMELVPLDNIRNGQQQQQPRANNQPMMSLSTGGGTNINFWGSGPVSVNIYPGERSTFNFHQTPAPNLNHPQSGPITVQSPTHFSSIPNANGHQFGAQNSGNGFPSPSFSEDSFVTAVSVSSVDNQQVHSTPSAAGTSAGETIASNSCTDVEVHQFTPRYSDENFDEFFDWALHTSRLDEDQNVPTEQSDPANSNGSTVAGASETVQNPPRQRKRRRHTAAPVSRPATRAYTRQQNQSL